MKKKLILIVPVVLLAVLAGLFFFSKKERPVLPPWAPRMTNPAPKTFKCGPAKTLDEMKDEDVIVAVNGVPLYKWQFTDELARYWWTIKQDQHLKAQELEAMYRRFGRDYIHNYIGSQVFIQAGRSQETKTFDATQIVARVERGILFMAHRFSMPPKELNRNIPGGLNALRYTLEDHLWKEAYIDSNVVVKPVSDSMISNIYAQIEMENNAIETTNTMQRAKIEKVYQRVKSGEDFGKLVDEFGEDSMVQKGKGGYWDSYQDAMDVPDDIKKHVFPLPVGGITPILQDDEGYYFIKLLKKTNVPQPTNMPPVIEYDMGRMFVPTEQYVVMPEGYNLKKSIHEQFRREAIAVCLTNLLDKAQVVYPNGTNFFGKAKIKKHHKKRQISPTERKARRIKKAMLEGKDPKQIFNVEKPGAKHAVKSSAKSTGKKATRKTTGKSSAKRVKDPIRQAMQKLSQSTAKDTGVKQVPAK